MDNMTDETNNMTPGGPSPAPAPSPAPPGGSGDVNTMDGQIGDIGASAQVNNKPSVATGNQPQRPNTGIGSDAPFTKPDHANNPAIHRASIIRSIAETLAGGQQYSIQTNAGTGEIERVPVPMSGRHIGMAIALEAISGGLSGLAAGRGRGAGAAGAAGFKQGQQIVQQRDEQQDKDFTRQATIAHTNMQMAANQKALGAADRDMHQKDVDTYAPLYKAASDIHAVDNIVGEDELHQMMQNGDLHITKDMVVPIRVSEKLGPDGKQMKGKYGEPLYEKQYAILKPNEKIQLPPEIRDMLVKARVPGYADLDGKPTKLPDNLELRIGQILQGIEKAKNIQLMADAFDSHPDQLNPYHKDSGRVMSGNKSASIQFSDPKIGDMVDSAAQKHGVDPGVARSLVMAESGGKANAVSDRGAVGIGQMMPSTARGVAGRKVSVDELKDPETNLDLSMQYLKGLIDKHDGDVRAALIDYHGKGSDGKTTGEHYADGILSKVKNVSLTPGGGTDSDVLPADKRDVYKAMAKGELTDKDAAAFNALGGKEAFLTGDPAKGDLSDAQKMAQQHPDRFPPESIGRLISFMGGQDAIDKARTDRVNHFADEKETRDLDKKKKEIDQKNAADKEVAAQNQRFLHVGPEGYRAKPEYFKLSVGDLQDQLKNDGVQQLPGIFDLLYQAGHYLMEPSDYAQRVWAKGSPDEMDRQTAKEFILKYINPQFNDLTYQDIHSLRKSASNPDSPFSKQVVSFQQFLQHTGEAIDANDSYRRLTGGELLNKPVSWWKQKMSGDPNFRDYLAAIEPAAKEYEQFLLNNHALQQQDREEITDLISGKVDRANAEIVLKRWALTAAHRAKDRDEQWYRVSGKHYPNFIDDDALYGIQKLTDKNGNNDTADILGELDNGGDLQQSPDGWGHPGRSVGSTVLPQGGGNKITPEVINRFIRATRGNAARARDLARSNGWTF